MKKKIGIAAVTYKENFGSSLQTYATQYVLEKMGYDARIFNINGVQRSIHFRKLLYYAVRVFDSVEFKYLMANLKSRSRKAASAKTDLYAQNMIVRKEAYRRFNEKWNKMLPYVKGWKELSKQASKMDAVVVGSDQNWRPSNIAGGFYTLEFVPNTIKKISFSTSFGVPELPKTIQEHAKSFLQSIDFISVRENSGSQIIKQLINKDVKVVCDPTMMLNAEEWMHIQDPEPIIKGDYILMYLMGDNPQQREFVKKIKDKTTYRIVGLLHGATYIDYDEDVADEKPYDVGPAEFVNIVRNAKYVCTDSFHCMVFSILNSVPFFGFKRWPDGSKFSANDRIYTLLQFTGLEKRLLNGDEDVEKCLNDYADFDNALQKVAQKREETFSFLEESLNL